MRNALIWCVVGVWAAALVAALVAGELGSDLVLWLFPVWVTAAAVVVATCYGIAGLLRIVLVAALIGVLLGVLEGVMPGGELVGLAAIIVALVVRDRVKARRRRDAMARVSFI